MTSKFYQFLLSLPFSQSGLPIFGKAQHADGTRTPFLLLALGNTRHLECIGLLPSFLIGSILKTDIALTGYRCI
jgi:hypothetical protein